MRLLAEWERVITGGTPFADARNRLGFSKQADMRISVGVRDGHLQNAMTTLKSRWYERASNS